MFSKTALIFLALGALYVNASTVPVAREPEFQDLMARLNFESAKREFLDDLFSREPEDRAQASKREPSPEPLPIMVASGHGSWRNNDRTPNYYDAKGRPKYNKREPWVPPPGRVATTGRGMMPSP